MNAPVLRRLAAVGVLVTAVDVLLLLLLAEGLGSAPALADGVSVLVASVVARRVHRRVTFADEPRARWVEEPGVFVRVTVLAAAVDVALLSLLADVTSLDLLVVKACSLSVAAVVRAVGYRAALQPIIRATQDRMTPWSDDAPRVRLSVVVPTYNDEERIGSTVSRLRAAGLADHVEIVVVVDGSPDDTAGAARSAGADQVLVLPENLGKGAAVRTGMLAAEGRTLV